MSSRLAFWAALSVVVLTAAWPLLAIAQEVVLAGPTEVTGQPLIDLIVQYAEAILAVMLPFAVAFVTLWVKQKTGVDIDKGLRDGFQTSATNAAGILIQRLGAKAATMSKLDIKNEHVADVVQMVINSVPDAVKKFNITPDQVAARIEAKLGILTGTTDAAGRPVVGPVAHPAMPAAGKPAGMPTLGPGMAGKINV